MGRDIHRLIRNLTGNDDPYRAVKEHSNNLALGILPDLRAKVMRSSDPFRAAVQMAAYGNVLDLGVRSELEDFHINEAIARAMTTPFDADTAELSDAVSKAERILYLADNAGEIVFDRLLIELLPEEKVTVAVRGRPVINDATMADAEAVGLTERVEVIDNGTDIPGTILAECSDFFRSRFERADLVISKGQGNYETLSDVEKDIFFLLKAKCPVVAMDLDAELDGVVLRRSKYAVQEIGVS
jgi:uncharacterized protein with ATP-grasp and redox domains